MSASGRRTAFRSAAAPCPGNERLHTATKNHQANGIALPDRRMDWVKSVM
jgi:hypothetical protein